MTGPHPGGHAPEPGREDVEIQGLAAYLATISRDPAGAWVAALKAARVSGVSLETVSRWTSARLAKGEPVTPVLLEGVIRIARSLGDHPVIQPRIRVKPGTIRSMVDEADGRRRHKE